VGDIKKIENNYSIEGRWDSNKRKKTSQFVAMSSLPTHIQAYNAGTATNAGIS